MRTAERFLLDHFMHGSLSEHLKQLSDNVQIEGALKDPRMRYIKTGLMTINLLEKSHSAARWLWTYRTAASLFAATWIGYDWYKDGMMIWMANKVLQTAAQYLFPVTALGLAAFSAVSLLQGQKAPAVADGDAPVQPTLVERIRGYQTQAMSTVSRIAVSALAGCDRAALSTAATIVSSFSPESPSLWLGWATWIISFLAGSHPSADITNSKIRLLIDDVEKKLTNEGMSLGNLISCLRLLNAHKDEIRYHTTGAVNQFSSRIYSLLGRLSHYLKEINDLVKQVYIQLDTIEEQLLLKPGLLTKPFEQAVNQLYDHLYFAGYNFGTRPSAADGARVYRETPPFTDERQQLAAQRQLALPAEQRHAVYTNNARFTIAGIDAKRRILKLLRGESISYCRMMAKRFDSKVSAYKLIRVAALLDGEPESNYLWLYKRGEHNLDHFIGRIQHHYPAAAAVANTCYDDSTMPAFDAAQDSSIEAYWLRASTARQAALDTADDAAVERQLRNLQLEPTGLYQYIYECFFALFSQNGLLDNLDQHLSSQGQRQLALLQGDADRIFNNHLLHPLERLTTILSLVKHYFPLESIDGYIDNNSRRLRDIKHHVTQTLSFFETIQSNPVFYKHYFDLFGRNSGIMSHHDDDTCKLILVPTITAEVDAHVNDHRLNPTEKIRSITLAIRRQIAFEPPEWLESLNLSQYRQLLAYFRAPADYHPADGDAPGIADAAAFTPQQAPLAVLDHTEADGHALPLTESIRARANRHIPESIKVYHFLRNHIQHDHGFLGRALYHGDALVEQSLQTLLNRVRDIAFSTEFDEAEKQKAICQRIFACHRQINDIPFIKAHLMHAQHMFFTPALVRECRTEAQDIRRRMMHRQGVLRAMIRQAQAGRDGDGAAVAAHVGGGAGARAGGSTSTVRARQKAHQKATAMHSKGFDVYYRILPQGVFQNKAQLDALFIRTLDRYRLRHRREDEKGTLANLLKIRQSFDDSVATNAHPAWDLITCVATIVQAGKRSELADAFCLTVEEIRRAVAPDAHHAPAGGLAAAGM